jgi:hypothetical protein
MRYRLILHDDRLGVRIDKRLGRDWSQAVFSARPFVIWTQRHQWGKARIRHKPKQASAMSNPTTNASDRRK